MMLVKEIKLWEDDEKAKLFTYILDNSKEFQVNKKKPAVIICPGGGYLGLSDREAEPIAIKFASCGYHAFVLRYNTCFDSFQIDFNNLPEENKKSIYPSPLFDLAKAMVIVKENSDEWFVDKDRISICGFSAGGHLAGSMAVHWHSELLQEKLKVSSEMFKPNAAILAYPVLDYKLMEEKNKESQNEFIKEFWKICNKALFGTEHQTEEEIATLSPVNYVDEKTVPTFIWHTADDDTVYVENSLRFATKLTKNNIPYELHIFEEGNHGLALSDEVTANEEKHNNHHCAHWFELALEWLKKY